MGWPNPKIFLLLFILSIPLFSQAADSQTARVKQVVDGDTLLLINGERVQLIGLETPEVHESKKLCQDVTRGVRGRIRGGYGVEYRYGLQKTMEKGIIGA